MIAAIVRTALVFALLLATGCSFYLSEPRVPKTDLRASLNGSNEVPPTQSRGNGYFEAVYRPSTKVLEYRLNLVGLSGPITMGYMHGPGHARRECPADRAHQHSDLRQHDLGRRHAHRGTGGRCPGRPLVRQCHHHRISRRRNPRPDPAAEEIEGRHVHARCLSRCSAASSRSITPIDAYQNSHRPISSIWSMIPTAGSLGGLLTDQRSGVRPTAQLPVARLRLPATAASQLS